MWLLAAVYLSCLLPGIPAQDRASFRRGNDRSGRCQYTFTVDSPTDASCPGGSDLEGLQYRLASLEAQVSRLAGGEVGTARTGSQGGLQEKYAQVAAERNQLQRDKERLETRAQELQGRLVELQREVQRLRTRPCQLTSSPGGPVQDGGQRAPSGSSIFTHLVSRPGGVSETAEASDPSWQLGRAAYQEFKAEVTELPAPRLNQKGGRDSTGCGELVSVGDPETVCKAEGISGKYGVWLQDPEPVAPYGPKTVWRLDAVGADVRQLFAYEDKQQLARGFPTKVLLLPEPVESTGATVYRGSLYYQRRHSRSLLRYDLGSESVAARRDLPYAGFHGQYPYSWGGYTDIDLAVDEQGLWAIYSTSQAKGAIVLSLLDPHTLEIRRSWETNIRKNMVANAFVICGRLYTLASYSSPNTTINYTFDTATNQSKAVAIPFRNRYRYNSMVDYNYANRKLYAWDNFHMVSYDVQLGDPDNI